MKTVSILIVLLSLGLNLAAQEKPSDSKKTRDKGKTHETNYWKVGIRWEIPINNFVQWKQLLGKCREFRCIFNLKKLK